MGLLYLFPILHIVELFLGIVPLEWEGVKVLFLDEKCVSFRDSIMSMRISFKEKSG
jgi:hypothetical protein